MRILLLSLTVLALGLGGVFLAKSPGASAQSRHAAATILTGNVGSSANNDAFTINLSKATVVPGTYQFNITDWSDIHNFHLCKGTSCTGTSTLKTTTIPGTGPVSWTLTLGLGMYVMQCDAHGTMKRTLKVAPSVTITSVIPKRTLVTVTAKASQAVKFTGWVLKGTTKLATATTTMNAATTTLKLKPATALKPGNYVVQVRAAVGGVFNDVRKTITVP